MVQMLHSVRMEAPALLYGLGLLSEGTKTAPQGVVLDESRPILSVQCTQRQIVREDHKGSAPATDGRLARFRLSQFIEGPAQ
jgi:hypothetical protein